MPYICDDPYFVRKYVSERLGIALAPSISWYGRFRENTKLIKIRSPHITTTSFLLWDERRYITPAVDAFRQYLITHAREVEGNLL
ncbi:MAG: hypothetical protein HFE84_01745 [Lachnospiraceae bacterium]|nr:hypothetical protein [Lachnospiraceae bacterium]